MKIEKAIEILKSHNKWRRGAEIGLIEPALIGQAIDTLIKYSEHAIGWRKEYDEIIRESLLGEK
jgi:hypothetical protein